jgi:hypothetical protein
MYVIRFLAAGAACGCLYFGAIGISVAGRAAHAFGQQVSGESAQFCAFVVIVVCAAKFFGAACVAWSKAPVTRWAGGTLAALCAVVTSYASWSTYIEWIRPEVVVATLLGVSPETLQAIGAAELLFLFDAMPALLVIGFDGEFLRELLRSPAALSVASCGTSRR